MDWLSVGCYRANFKTGAPASSRNSSVSPARVAVRMPRNASNTARSPSMRSLHSMSVLWIVPTRGAAPATSGAKKRLQPAEPEMVEPENVMRESAGARLPDTSTMCQGEPTRLADMSPVAGGGALAPLCATVRPAATPSSRRVTAPATMAGRRADRRDIGAGPWEKRATAAFYRAQPVPHMNQVDTTGVRVAARAIV
jgi:hypothetical protein